MSTGPAADLARLKVQHGAHWRIDRQDGPMQETATGPGFIGAALFTATHRRTGTVVRDESAAGLTAKITRQEGRWGGDAS